jgi:hypothetical protein
VGGGGGVVVVLLFILLSFHFHRCLRNPTGAADQWYCCVCENMGFVFAREFWYLLLRQFGLPSLAPHMAASSFLGWWEKAARAVSGLIKKDLNSLIILGAWRFGITGINASLMVRIQI